MLNTKISFLIALNILLLNIWVVGQQGLSPLSGLGIGSINEQGFTTNLSMGGLGISNSNANSLTNTNPALLTKNDIASFSMGILVDKRKVADLTNTTTNVGGGLNYVAMGLPLIKKKWTMGLGISPYSTVNYDVTYTDMSNFFDQSHEITYKNTGSGGYNQAYILNGIRINPNFSIGLKTSFLFSSITEQASSEIDDLPTFGIPTTVTMTSVRDVVYGLGMSYQGEISEDKVVKVGTTYDFNKSIYAERTIINEQQRTTGAEITQSIKSEEEGSITLPSRLGFGISLEKKKHWLFGIDYINQDWSQFRNFDDNSQNLTKSSKIILGGQLLPNFENANQNFIGYLARTTYRAGIYYQSTPYVINDTNVDDFGITFGSSFPVNRLSNLDLAFKWGRQGSINDNDIKENYFKLYLAVSINDNRWFYRPKID